MSGIGHEHQPSPWLDRLLAEDTQRAFLVVSGCIIFILGTFVLSLESPVVAHEIRIYSWAHRTPGKPAQLRAIGFDRKEHRFEAVALCENQAQITPSNAAEDGYALPLILETQTDIDEVSLCLKIENWAERHFKVKLPPHQKKGQANKTRSRETEVFSADPYPKFPFAHAAVPQEGIYNPMNPDATLLFWLDAEKAIVRHEATKGEFEDVQAGADGLYRIPMQNRGLIGKSQIQVEKDGETYSREFRFHPRARETLLTVEPAGPTVDINLRLVNRSVPRTHDPHDNHATRLICSLMSGEHALTSTVVQLNDEARFITQKLPNPDLPGTLLSIICDPNPLGGDSDSVSSWVLAAPPSLPNDTFLKFARASLVQQMNRPMAKRILRWYRDGTPQEKQRAVTLLLAASQPIPITMASIASTYEKDLDTVTTSYQGMRNRIFGVLAFLLFLWFTLTIITVLQRRHLRTQAIQRYLDDDPDDEVAAELIARGKDALARPRSNMLALGMVLILLSHILGLLWVLWNL